MVTLLLVLLGCGREPAADEAPPEMDPVALAVRISLDLRGVRPSIEELEAVEADPAALDDLVDAWLQDDRFPGRVRDLFADVWSTRTDGYTLPFEAQLVADPAALTDSIGEEALMMLAHVAEEGLPTTELVRGDWTMADEHLAAVWPVDYPDGATGWQRVRYTDGRPAAGVLATNSFYWRYTSTVSNANRGRANAISRIFLCHDYLVRPIDFDRNVNLLDEGAVLDALASDPGCVNCHVSLDPIASYLYGFWYTDANSLAETATYHPEREKEWQSVTGVAPGWFGEAGWALTDLGASLASDPRFPACTVQQVYEVLLRREVDIADTDELVAHREAFLSGGLTLRPLFRSVVSSPRYRAGETDAAGYVPRKMVTPELLASQVEGLTGFRWTAEGEDLLTDTFHTLAGGADGLYVTSSATSPNATLLLVQKRLAEAAATHAVAEDPHGLFGGTALDDVPDEAARIATLQRLHLAIFGRRVDADGEEVEANVALWEELYAVRGDPEEAWAGLLSALLRDPDLLFY